MEYLNHLLILIGIYSILGISLNLVMGYTGLVSATHAAFYGIGAYATAILTRMHGFDFFASVGAGIIITMFAAFLIGIVCSRFRDDYYIIATLGFNFIIYSIMLNWQSLTRGPLGIPGIPKPGVNFLFLVSIFLLLIYLVSRFIGSSSFGRVLKAIREDEKAIQVFGYNTKYYKLAIFVIAASMAAIAGSLFASYISFIDPSSFTFNESVFILAIVILGGLANLKGSILGAAFLVLMPEILRFIGFPPDIAAQTRLGVYGLLLVLLMLYRPQGLMGEYKL